MGSSTNQHIVAKRVAIIGAGASGLAAAKFLRAERFFTKIDVYEQRSNVGGLWEYTPEDAGDGMFKVPQTDPHQGVEKPIWLDRGNGEGKQPIFLSPVYERLEANIPRGLMRYAELDFDDDIQLFPKHGDVQRYLEKYAEDVRDLVKFTTQVTKAWPYRDSAQKVSWTVVTEHIPTDRVEQHSYDALVVATGHYSVSHIPDIPGIAAWNEAHPGSISHSKYYRVPEAFAGQRVVVVGNSASGLDISSQIAEFCTPPLFLSSKTASYLAPGFKSSPCIENVSEITSCDPPTRTVRFKDGRTATGIDRILFCTGYLYSLPFLDGLLHPSPIGDGSRVQHTYQHLFFAPEPTLAFLALPQKVIPFPLAEAQAAVVARVYAGRLPLPPPAAVAAWEEAALLAATPSPRRFHALQYPKDAEYINLLCDWAAQAEPRDGLEGEGGGCGKSAARWGEWHCWARERFPAIRRAFVGLGERRGGARGLEDVGFDFEAWRSGEEGQRLGGER